VNRETYTKIFLQQTNEALTEDNIKSKTRLWWKNSRTKSEGGLRLTDEGLEFVTKTLDLAAYEIPFPLGFDLKAQVIIFLDQFIDCPYYLSNVSITVLSERKCFELHLFAGDVEKYGLNKAMTRKKASQNS
jgi:hypothetical protein